MWLSAAAKRQIFSMELRFSETGPGFPFALVDAMLEGKVVFLCGAGISAPMLPGFWALVTKCFEKLNVEHTLAEKAALHAGRYEEVLGSLERRLAEPALFTRTIAQQLTAPAKPNLSNHSTILRLSRDLNNRPCVVTTNFDILLEKAYFKKSKSKTDTQAQSLAGQEIPRPGTAEFSGIIHLHGRLSDNQLGLSQTPLIVTSSEYGDAYMRSGWASRFLFDLCRCKTIVLVGYSASDAPVRYFLNVLEADRERFSDLHKVYALDSEPEPNKPSPGWEALGVVPLVYQKEVEPSTGNKGHAALWRDLAHLADIVERPRIRRREMASAVLAKPLESIDKFERQSIRWLFKGQRDLNLVAIKTITDKAWFKFFHDEGIWSDEDATVIITGWIASDLQSIDRYQVAIDWLEKLGKPFVDRVFQLVIRKEELPSTWKRAWRLMSHLKLSSRADWVNQPYAVVRRLNTDVVLNSDLQLAIEMLSPKLKLRASFFSAYAQPPAGVPKSLHEIVWARLSIPHEGELSELSDVLSNHGNADSILNIATEKFHESVRLAVDIGAIEDDYDRTNHDVPSVEFHAQNDCHGGLVLLAQLLTSVLPKAAQRNRNAALSAASTWRTAPGLLGTRLWLNAQRNVGLFTADEALACLLDASDNVFWNTDREVPLLIKERAPEANDSAVSALEQRILNDAEKYFQAFEIETGQVDWRAQAQDAGVWLRLNMLDAAHRISERGTHELAQIKKRRPYLNRPVEESDFFSSYSSGVQVVRGDAQPLIDAPELNRLEVAKASQLSQDIEKRHGWRAYCNLDPDGAFQTLRGAPLDIANAPLWESYVSALSIPDAGGKDIRTDLVVDVFKILKQATDEFLSTFVRALCSLYELSPRDQTPSLRGWWQRLFSLAVSSEVELIEAPDDFYLSAINSSGGRLATVVLQDIEKAREDGVKIAPRLGTALYACANGLGIQGSFARAVLVRHSHFVTSLNFPRVKKRLCLALSSESQEGKFLRKILVCNAAISERVSHAFHEHVLQGVMECEATGNEAQNAAAKILVPALSILRKTSTAEAWGISSADAALTLRNSMPEIHAAAAGVLVKWNSTFEGAPEVKWRTLVRPLLEEVWPKEKVFKTQQTTRHLVRLVICSGDAFPEALDYVRPYLVPLETLDSHFLFMDSKHPEEFPHKVLDLLWVVLSESFAEGFNIAETLDRILQAAPELEVDRRFQWLDRRTLRF